MACENIKLPSLSQEDLLIGCTSVVTVYGNPFVRNRSVEKRHNFPLCSQVFDTGACIQYFIMQKTVWPLLAAAQSVIADCKFHDRRQYILSTSPMQQDLQNDSFTLGLEI